ncbi:decarboxylase [Rossellomorea vietnamensis]|uniref:Decarboxylase n=1 Tax=Rossellomorea vietnamensis TaxID=218284 RepID=A0A6I6UE41_9BACI|nr:decarboxylase [Rossellomorea vietnamensis]QHE59797.1 decarboxylase [Rossellomorea vietnamensis]
MTKYHYLLQKYGSPIYVYNLADVTAAYNHIRYILPSNSTLYYSLKANPNLFIVTHLIKLGCKPEVSSTGELNVALSAGANPEECLYTGPGKTKKEIQYAISKGVDHFSIESIFEFEILQGISDLLKKSINVTIRINPANSIPKASINMTGVPSQFGVEEDELLELINKLNESDFLKINGFHIYNGSNFKGCDRLIENFENNLIIISNLCEKLNIKLSFIDLGGGFAAPFANKSNRVDYSQIRVPLSKLVKKFYPDEFQKPEIAFEIGRYLTSTSGVLAGTIQNVKKSKGKKYCVTDFGINHLGGMGGLRRLPSSNVDVLLCRNRSCDLEETNIVGPLCTPLDYISKKSFLPKDIKPYETVFIPNVGAYGLSASLIGFLSRDIPREIILEGDKVIGTSQMRIIVEGDVDGN